eukprot:gb/GECG01005825.1/.p1 GENE.gb/GECG01005825.1/~~gb/GECG01005825.1/.p1  ORF type:complete len:354 (+),score=69.96 gb/GECG01005825.1/:1-1062(+)
MFFAEIVPAEYESNQTDNFFVRLTLEYTDDKAKEAAEPEPTRKQSSSSTSEAAANKKKASNRRAREKKLKKVLQSSSAEKADLSKVEAIEVLCLRRSPSSPDSENEVRYRAWEGKIHREDLETLPTQNSQEPDESDRKKGDDLLRQILFAFLQTSNFSMGEVPLRSVYNVGISLPSDDAAARISVTITKQSDSDSTVTYTLHQLDLNPSSVSVTDPVTSILLSGFQSIDHMENCGRHYQDLSEKVQKQFAEVSEVANDAVRAKNEFYEGILTKMTLLLNEKKKEIARLRGEKKNEAHGNEGSGETSEEEDQQASGSEGETAATAPPSSSKRGRMAAAIQDADRNKSSKKRTRK